MALTVRHAFARATHRPGDNMVVEGLRHFPHRLRRVDATPFRSAVLSTGTDAVEKSRRYTVRRHSTGHLVKCLEARAR